MAVKLKITKYLRRAEEIFNCHLQRTLGSGASPDEVRSPQRPEGSRGRGLRPPPPRPVSCRLAIPSRADGGEHRHAGVCPRLPPALLLLASSLSLPHSP